jgi:hypothetical protein
MSVVLWLVPICAFLLVGSMYLGGGPVRIVGGGGVRQTGGLLVSLAVFLAVAVLLRNLLAGGIHMFFAVLLSTIVALLLLPVLCRLGFLVFGVRLERIRDGGGSH